LTEKNHHYYKRLLMGLLDGELSVDDEKDLQSHMKGCEECSRELEGFNRMKGVMGKVKYIEPPDEAWEKYWSRVHNRLERGLSWILISIGAVILLFYGGFKAVESLIKDPTLAVILKVAILVLLAGLAILFVSVIRERIFTYKRDRYAKEVKRC